jgi:hypothetical protein
MDKVTIRNADELIEHGVTWNHEPGFEFTTEVDALQTVEVLGDQLRAAREQVRQIMRWIEVAVPAAHHNGEGETQPQAIINHSGLARQTVYDILKKETAVQNTQRLAEQIAPTLRKEEHPPVERSGTSETLPQGAEPDGSCPEEDIA